MRSLYEMVESNLLPMFTFFVFVFGMCIGSFLNVVAERVPAGESINGRSHCDYCHKTLQWFDLIPVVSYFSTMGTCRYCHKKISSQYFLVEILTGVLFVISFVRNQYLLDLNLLKLIVVSSCAVVILITDIKWQIILDEALIPLLAIGLITTASLLPFYLGGSLIAATLFLLLHVLSSGQAMGYADVKLVFAMGFLLTLPNLFLALYIAFLTGGVLSVILLIGRFKKLQSRIALGPFLVIGLLCALWL